MIFAVWGTINIATVQTAKGIATALKNGILLPPLKFALSDQEVTSGSVTASNIRPTAVIRPKSVIDAIIGDCVINSPNMPFVSPSA